MTGRETHREAERIYRTAAYIRLSREDGDKAESDSIANQRKLLEDYLRDREEFVLYDTYVDDGFTGTHFRRPGFLRMMQDIEEGKVDCVLVKDLSRFGRDYIETGKYLERCFPERGVRFLSVADNIDSGKGDYDILLPLKNIFNEQYARDISQKVHSSMRAKQRAGEFIGAFAPYGYRKSPADKNRLVVDEYAAGVVRRIFAMYINGAGKNRIAAELNGEGIVCPSEYKRQNGEAYQNGRRLEHTSYWTYSTVHRLLQNEMYTGSMVQGKKTQRMRGKQRAVERKNWVVVPGTHEPVIDEATWEKAQELLKRRAREPDLQAGRTVFAGFLKCGDCGRALVKKTCASGRGRGPADYYCGTYMRSGRQYCTPHKIPHLFLEELIGEDLKTLLRGMEDLGGLFVEAWKAEERAEPAKSREKERLLMELGKSRRLRQGIYEDYREGLLSREEYLAYRQEYSRKEECLRERLEGLGEEAPPKEDAQALAMSRLGRLLEQGGPLCLGRDILAEMLQQVTVYEGRRVEITYRFSSGQEFRRPDRASDNVSSRKTSGE